MELSDTAPSSDPFSHTQSDHVIEKADLAKIRNNPELIHTPPNAQAWGFLYPRMLWLIPNSVAPNTRVIQPENFDRKPLRPIAIRADAGGNIP